MGNYQGRSARCQTPDRKRFIRVTCCGILYCEIHDTERNMCCDRACAINMSKCAKCREELGLRDRIIAYGERRRLCRIDPVNPLYGPIEESMSCVWPSRTVMPTIGSIDTEQGERKYLILNRADVKASAWLQDVLIWTLASYTHNEVLYRAFPLCMRHLEHSDYDEAALYSFWCVFLTDVLNMVNRLSV